MKLPRWLLLVLIIGSVLACSGASWYWWTMWPQWRAQEVRSLIDQRRFAELNGCLPVNGRWVVVVTEESDWELEPRSLGDLLIGRCYFREIGFEPFGPIVQILIERGKILCYRKWPSLGQPLQGGVDQTTLSERLKRSDGWLAKTVAETPDDGKLSNEIFVQLLARPPNQSETRVVEQQLAAASNRVEAAVDVAWALLNSREFRANQ